MSMPSHEREQGGAFVTINDEDATLASDGSPVEARVCNRSRESSQPDAMIEVVMAISLEESNAEIGWLWERVCATRRSGDAIIARREGRSSGASARLAAGAERSVLVRIGSEVQEVLRARSSCRG